MSQDAKDIRRDQLPQDNLAGDRTEKVDEKVITLLNSPFLPFAIAIGGMLGKPLLRIPTDMPDDWRRRFESLGYEPSPEEAEEMYKIYKMAAKAVFEETYGK